MRGFEFLTLDDIDEESIVVEHFEDDLVVEGEVETDYAVLLDGDISVELENDTEDRHDKGQ
jgi:hypothetical protein